MIRTRWRGFTRRTDSHTRWTDERGPAKIPAVEADLIAVANAGNTRDATAGKKAGSKLVADFDALAAAVSQLGKKLGLN